MLAVPGAMEAGVTAVLFWAALAFSLAVAFVLTTPVNRWLMSRGKGHAVVHTYHRSIGQESRSSDGSTVLASE